MTPRGSRHPDGPPANPPRTGAVSASAPVHTRLDELAAEYEITSELGRGGTAVVYHARDRDLGREVAIKVVRQTHVDDADAVARLAREARLVAQLRHPNIVTLYGTRHLGDGSLALIMQYVPGRTLKAAIRENGPLPIAMVESVLRELALALQYAHQRQGLVHRDIKPENIYLDTEGGRTLLSDFGIARSNEVESSLTLAGTALGTPAYMSPEQIDGLPLDGRSDLYSLGLVAYEMLTAQQPWAGHNLYTTIYKQKREHLPSLHELRRDVPAYMQHAIEGLLHKDRDQRWNDAARFLAELRPAVAPSGLTPPAITRWAGGRSAAAEVMDDLPTIVYRRNEQGEPVDLPQSSEHQSNEPHTSEPQSHAPPTSEPQSYAPDESSVPAAEELSPAPIIRFSFDADDDPQPAGIPMAPEQPRASKRRLPALIGMAVLLTLAGAMAPLIGAGGDNETLDVPMDPATSATPSDAATLPAVTGGVPARVIVLDARGSGQTGEPLESPVVLLVEDAEGRPVPGIPVEIEVHAGGGYVFPELAVSDSTGRAMTRWTLGEVAGTNELSARIRGMPETATLLRAMATAGAAARLVVLSGANQTGSRGSVLADTLLIRVEDARGNPVVGARVDFASVAGGGTAHPAFAITDTAGVAGAAWRLGAEQESHMLRARLAQSDLQVDFTARATFRMNIDARIVAGGTHTCTLTAVGGATCWGANDNGQLGMGAAERVSGATAVRAATPLARIAAGVSHTCALDRDGRASCWGVNDAGQLGVMDQSNRTAPAPVRADESFTAITAGRTHTCALSDEGIAFCWGDGSSGQLGDGTDGSRRAPVRVAGGQRFRSLSAGWRHMCGLTTQNRVYCWGSNSDGQLGDGTTTNRSFPARVSDNAFIDISAGAAHTCAINSDGEAYCWGQNTSGQLGSGNRSASPRPARVQTAIRFASITAGAVHTCGLTRDGDAYCWGRNNLGQLGNENGADSSAPVAVSGGHSFTALSASGSHTCGRADTGEYYCWGYNVEGQLGDGTRNDHSRPVRVHVAIR